MNNITSTTTQRKLTGTVISDRMNKTRVIEVARLKKHPRYQKFFKVTTHFKAHDEKNEFHTGDVVIIGETRPLSKDKRWEILQLVEKGSKKVETIDEQTEA